MKIVFPKEFEFGTSTAAYQIETAHDHDWKGVIARDGYVFDQTTGHEINHDEDAGIIASLAPNYRMSLMWSKLQSGPFQVLNPYAVEEYSGWLQKLKERNVKVMMVIHHFANPLWFAKIGGWEKEQNISIWVDYAKKLISTFDPWINSYNTFNEPNLYTSLGWIAGEFPPFRKKNFITARTVINNIARAHNQVYAFIKEKYPAKTVGISHNCTVFEPDNILGKLPAAVFDWCFMEYAASLFQNADFFGLSYYARIGFDPFPVTYLLTPKKIHSKGKQHDDMWEYHPEGLGKCLKRYWNTYKKPLIITENGFCSSDDTLRIKALRDYMGVIKKCLDDGVDVRGYYHWSTWDNFEWSLGPTYRFGLYSCDLITKERKPKPSAEVFSKLSYSKAISL